MVKLKRERGRGLVLTYLCGSVMKREKVRGAKVTVISKFGEKRERDVERIRKLVLCEIPL